jgi:hypothetical protein
MNLEVESVVEADWGWRSVIIWWKPMVARSKHRRTVPEVFASDLHCL